MPGVSLLLGSVMPGRGILGRLCNRSDMATGGGISEGWKYGGGSTCTWWTVLGLARVGGEENLGPAKRKSVLNGHPRTLHQPASSPLYPPDPCITQHHYHRVSKPPASPSIITTGLQAPCITLHHPPFPASLLLVICITLHHPCITLHLHFIHP